MDSSLQSSPAGNLEHKAGFRKPSTDTVTRNYRKRSPVDRSPSSDEDHEHDNSYSPKHAKQGSTGQDYLGRKKDDEKELSKDSDRSHYGKSGDSHRYNERNAPISHHGKFSDGDRQSREAPLSDQRTRQYDHSKSRDKDKYSRDKHESSGRRSKDREKEAASSEYQKYRDKTCPRSESGRGRDDRGEKRDHHRSSRNHRSGWEIEESITADRANSRDRAKGHYESGDVRVRENQRIVKERDVDDSNVLREKGQAGRVGKSLDDKSVPDRDQKSPSKKSRFSSDGGPVFVKGSSDARKQESLEGNSKANPAQAHGASDLNTAKFAAMRAAELVNQNLGGGAGFMSTEQKKKLLWGNKKSSVATEESTRQWDVSSIGDPERQEKFNKLMGVKGGISKEGSNAEKHKELQIDLEKQYTAGLRRRDGRTVGLGL